jgi:hypothetical protein
LDASRVEDKFKVAWSWVKMAFSLASTRAAGSNTYKNARVNVYGARMKRLHDVLSDDDTECMRFFREFVMGTQGGRREGCLVYEALVAYIKVLQKANHDAWQLRPDNLFLLIQIITSDLMLAMNFHGGVVGVSVWVLVWVGCTGLTLCAQGAENGIGGTLIVHDGGGAYRSGSSSSSGVCIVCSLSGAWPFRQVRARASSERHHLHQEQWVRSRLCH